MLQWLIKYMFLLQIAKLVAGGGGEGGRKNSVDWMVGKGREDKGTQKV